MIRLQTLGAVDLRRDGTEMRSVLAQPKRFALLAYLACAGGAFHSRDTLLGLFWPEHDAERARNALRQAVHYLRKSLGEGVITGRGERELGVDPALLVCDVAAFDRAVATGRPEEALELYRGDFMPGFYLSDAPDIERWIDETRSLRHRQALICATSLATDLGERGDWRGAALWARRAIALAPHEEASLRLLLTCLDRAGERALALDAFHEFARRLRQEYGIEPSAELLRDMQRLETPAANPPTATPVRSAPASETPQTANVERTGHSLVEPAPVDAASPCAPSVEAAERPRDARSQIAIERRAVGTAPVAPPRANRRALVAVTAVLALALAGAGWFVANRRTNDGVEPLAPTIAVLPFVNLSGAADDEHISDGVTEEILNALGQLEGLRVAARTSSFAFKGRNMPVDSIGNALGVNHILEGSIRRTGQRIKITAQLVDTRDGFHRWSHAYDRELTDVFALQEEIARAIASALEIRLARSPNRSAAKSDNAAAYDMYLRGRHLVSTTSDQRNREAIAAFEQALQLDPDFAAAHAGLASALIAMAEFVRPADVLPRAKLAALRALELDSMLVDTRLVLADVHQVLDRDWAAAEAEFKRAIALDAGSDSAHAGYMRFLLNSQRYDEALREAEKVWTIRALDAPDSLLPAFRQARHIAWSGYELRAGNAQRALTLARDARDIDPLNVTAHWLMALVQLRLDRPAEAVAELERVRDMTGGAAPWYAQLGYAYGRAGRNSEARQILASLYERARTSYVPKDQIALVHLGLGAPDSALAWLRTAVDEYHWWMPSTNAHPLWADLHDDPRFRQLMRSIGAP